jgi:hypothetical protein
MQIQINTDHNIEGKEALAAQVRGIVKSALSRISGAHHASGSPHKRREQP